MLREYGKPNPAFLFIGRSPSEIVVYRSDSKDQPFRRVPILPQNQTNSLILAFEQTNNQCVALYEFHTNDWQRILGFFPVVGGQWLVGFALASTTNSSSRVSAEFNVQRANNHA